MRNFFLLSALCLAACSLAQTFATTPYTQTPVTAQVPWYTIKPDLSNVANRKILPKLTDEQRKALVANDFLVRPTAEEQLFYIYENNAYQKIGSFATTDSVLHTYHIFYDFTLRYLEKERLFLAVKQLSRLMLAENEAALQGQHPAEITQALSCNVVFFAVPLVLLGEKPTLPTPALQQQVDAEVQRIMAHQGKGIAITGAEIDYTQFIPRGHYTRTPAFSQYFRAMMWYGLVPMSLEVNPGELDKPATLQALIISSQLLKSASMRALWQQLYDPTVFYVGSADDLSYYDYGKLIPRAFGEGTIDRFADDAKLETFYTQAKKELAHPGIENFTSGGLQGQQFRFMGQRFIPDSRIMQELTDPKVGTEENPRDFPYGLDVFAVLGSPRAAQLLDNVYHQTQYQNYVSQRQKMQREIDSLTPQQWQQNLYYGWMYTLRPLLPPRPEGYPAFMRNQAWQEKSLMTALGSWTELRHDTILYAKQSGAECGEGGELPPPVLGYVEPEVGVYERLSWLLKLNEQGLLARNLVKKGDEVDESFGRFIELTDFLATASRKELRNQPLSRDELHSLEQYGAQLEWLMLSVATLGSDVGGETSWWQIENKTDRSMGLVADVHTYSDETLEEAVGNAAEIWVVVPIQGKLRLVRGATFTYYEFRHPASDRLTDEAWQRQMQQGKTPPMPIWVRHFLLGPGIHTPTPTYELDQGQTGC